MPRAVPNKKGASFVETEKLSGRNENKNQLPPRAFGLRTN